jgi:hypothetical protein
MFIAADTIEEFEIEVGALEDIREIPEDHFGVAGSRQSLKAADGLRQIVWAEIRADCDKSLEKLYTSRKWTGNLGLVSEVR